MYQLYYMQYRRLIQYFSKNALRGIKRGGIHLEKSPQNKRAVVSWQGAQWGGSIMERVKKLQNENHELTKLRDWLLPMLMNGQTH